MSQRRGRGIRRDRIREHTPATLSAADAELAATLHSLDGANNYRDWLLSLFLPHLGTGSVIYEVGAGHGTFTRQLAEHGRVIAVEPSDHGYARLSERFQDDDRVTVVHGDHRAVTEGSADLIILSNVLEHIPDDRAALSAMAAGLKPGGRMVVFCPAFDLLYSRFDSMVGHYRRYRAPALESRLLDAGLDVAQTRYVNLAGFFMWLIYARLLRRIPTRPGAVTFADRFVIPVMRRIETVVKPPFGQSVLCVGQRSLG